MLFAVTILMLNILSVYSLDYTQQVQGWYTKNATLECKYEQFEKGIVPFIRYWVLPDGSTINQDLILNSKYLLTRPEVSLTVINIDDSDFGDYYCVILWDNYVYSMNVVRNEIYGSIFERYRLHLIIAGSVAGGLLITLIVVCVVYKCRHRRKGHKDEETKAVYDLDKAIQSYDNNGKFAEEEQPKSVSKGTQVIQIDDPKNTEASYHI